MTLFTDNLPLITSSKELQSLIEQYPKYDPYYIASGSIKDWREKFDDLFRHYHSFADRHFLSEVKRRFHQRTWEMYLSVVLLNRGIRFSSQNSGPDILIEFHGKKIWIECVACEKGGGADQVPDMIWSEVQPTPDSEMLLRLASVLKDKFEKYCQYVRKGVVQETDQFIIAVNTGGLRFFGGHVPLILRCVFAAGHPTISFPIGGGSETHSISTIPFIEKKSGAKVPMTFFLEEKHNGVTGVFHCGNNVLNHSDVIGEDIVLVPNPMAKNHLPVGLFDSFRAYKFDENGEIHF